MIIPINWLNYYVTIYRYMKMTYRNHDMEDYIDYHDIRLSLRLGSQSSPDLQAQHMVNTSKLRLT